MKLPDCLKILHCLLAVFTAIVIIIFTKFWRHNTLQWLQSHDKDAVEDGRLYDVMDIINLPSVVEHDHSGRNNSHYTADVEDKYLFVQDYRGSVENGTRENTGGQDFNGFFFSKPGSPLIAHNEVKLEKRVMKIMDYHGRPDPTLNRIFSRCEYNSCAMTSDQKTADLVMFSSLSNVTIPPKPVSQRWLMYYRKIFDTLVYDPRLYPENQPSLNKTAFSISSACFGVLETRPQPRKDYEQIYKGKKFDVAWFVSNCNTKSLRREYVKRMMSRVDIHIFGRCGNRTCPKMRGGNTDCFNILSKNYKFYLSFENSFCNDYITEKFFKMFPDTDVIPVVRGGADYRGMFPSGIFINAADFQSPESLGEYLYKLSRNETQYIKMLEKKNGYTKRLPVRYDLPCELCKVLHTGQPVTICKGNSMWLHRAENCWPPPDL